MKLIERIKQNSKKRLREDIKEIKTEIAIIKDHLLRIEESDTDKSLKEIKPNKSLNKVLKELNKLAEKEKPKCKKKIK